MTAFYSVLIIYFIYTVTDTVKSVTTYIVIQEVLKTQTTGVEM